MFIVLMPVLVLSMGYGFYMGLLMGILTLPFTFLLRYIPGFPELTPGSAVILEFLGIVIGSTIGFMSDYFSDLDAQIRGSHKLSMELSRKTHDKEILIQELHHRVKNNLTLVLSLIQLQATSSTSKEFKDAMQVVSQRIRAIASVHDNIYTQGTNTTINLQEHLQSLCRAVIDSYQIENLRLQEDLQFHAVLSVQKAIPLSLIIQEILTNSCKHAFSPKQKDPQIFVHGRDTEQEFILIVSDNGHRKKSGRESKTAKQHKSRFDNYQRSCKAN